jgi:uncharacterized membrane protein
MKASLFKVPEYYLLILLLLAGYTPPFSFNPIFGIGAVILLLQIVFRNRIAGLVIGSLFFLGNLYFLGALLSEFAEFSSMTGSAASLLLMGMLIWTANLLASVGMLYNYSRPDRRQAGQFSAS